MDEFLERMRQAQDLRGVVSMDGLSERVARVLSASFHVGAAPGDCCRLSWFYECCEGFPVRLYPARCHCSLESVFKKPFKTALWGAYAEQPQSTASAHFGIAATLGTQTIYVLHSLMTLPTPYGSMVHLKHTDGMEGRFETLSQFVDSVRQVWSP